MPTSSSIRSALRIVQAFLGDRALTTAQLREEMPTYQRASLYRHLACLVVDGGVLSLVSERRVRGAVERTYLLRTAAASISLDELKRMTPDEHRQAFLAYLAGLIEDFDSNPSLGAFSIRCEMESATTWQGCGSTTQSLQNLPGIWSPSYSPAAVVLITYGREGLLMAGRRRQP